MGIEEESLNIQKMIGKSHLYCFAIRHIKLEYETGFKHPVFLLNIIID